jgi:hydroxymethylpyrimidine pyrophosphatase-like HAD family hydrolase
MNYAALATDYDGTIACEGRVDAPTLEALRRARQAALRLVMVTGRELPDLARVFPDLELFERVVAENGALVYDPSSGSVRVLADLGVPWHVIINRGSVMALPSGITKATGLAEVLAEVGVPPERIVGVGDAENDLAFLAMCGLAVAVANALPAVKEAAAVVTAGAQGAGFVELVDQLLSDRLDRTTVSSPRR